MKNSGFILLIITILSVFFTGCASYPYSGNVEIRDEDVWVKVAFNDRERKIIHDYYRLVYRSFPPGLAKKDKLPPGLQKQLIRRGKLPPGLDYRLLPVELEQRLSPLPRGYIRLNAGGDIILLDEFTRVVLDIIYDAGL